MLKRFKRSGLVSVLVFSLVIALTGLMGCEQPGDDCYYDIGGTGSIRSARVFYPCELEDSNDMFNATTLSGGFTNSKEDMYWLAEHLRDEGTVVFAISARNNMTVGGYTSAHLDGFDLMGDENENPDSPVYHKIGKRALTGYSMGGGAVLDAANDLGGALDAVIALAPFNPESRLNDLDAAAIMIVGQNDSVAPPRFSENAYDAISDSTVKCLIELDDFSHMSWVDNTSSSGDTPRLLIADWLDLNLNGNTSKLSTFTNPPNDVVINENNL